MNNYANVGFLLKALELKSLLPVDRQQEYQQIIEDGNWEDAEQFLAEYLPDELPAPDEVFIFGDEDESPDLQCGEMYASWDEDQLFTRIPTPYMLALRKVNIEPQECHWVTWG